MFKREIIWYQPRLKEYARKLRNNPTPAEKHLWQFLKGKRVKGYDFHRQRPINYFIVDFYCSELKLAIELDGKIHDFQQEKDSIRQEFIEESGVQFLRFTNEQVLSNTQMVISEIENWIENFEKAKEGS